eukprot:3219717-Pleurochrysis_carterae.AAC.1
MRVCACACVPGARAARRARPRARAQPQPHPPSLRLRLRPVRADRDRPVVHLPGGTPRPARAVQVRAPASRTHCEALYRQRSAHPSSLR